MSSRLTRDDARALGLEILRRKPDPAVRVRLLRDVLCVAREDQRLRDARQALEDSAHLRLLRAEQRADGSWGRLHSRDTSAAQAVPTTEWAVERALALGLDTEHPVLAAAARHLESILEGRAVPPDPQEKSDRWEAGVRLFAAATLARIDARRPGLDETWNLWHEVARRTFVSGVYDAASETEAHRALTGASVAGTFLALSSRYAIELLASRAERMDPDLRRGLSLWVGQKPDGVGYHGVPLAAPRQGMSAGELERFLLSHEIAAGLGAPGAATGPLADWLGRGRRADGLWDLGSRATWTAALPLSETWRRANARAIDWTVRVLALLTRWLA